MRRFESYEDKTGRGTFISPGIMVGVDLGYPPRPVSAGELDKHLHAGDATTPKANGMRGLTRGVHNYCPEPNSGPGTIYGRLKQRLHYGSQEEGSILLREIDSHLKDGGTPEVHWWDMEFFGNGPNKGKAIIIDCCTGDDRDYHARRQLFDALPTIDPFVEETEVANVISKFPVWDSGKAFPMYEQMKERYFAYAKEGKENEYLWEGVVTNWVKAPYELTRKQSDNLQMQTKNRFR